MSLLLFLGAISETKFPVLDLVKLTSLFLSQGTVAFS